MIAPEPRVRSWRLTTANEVIHLQSDVRVVLEWASVSYVMTALYSSRRWDGIKVGKITIFDGNNVKVIPDPGFLKTYPAYPVIGWAGNDTKPLIDLALSYLPKVGQTEVDENEVGYESSFMEDVVVPDFKLRSLKGEIFNNPMRKVRTKSNISPRRHFVYESVPAKVTTTTVVVSRVTAQAPVLNANMLIANLPVGFLNYGNTEDIASAMLHGKLAQSDDTWGVTFAERQQTIDHLFLTASRILSIYRAVKSGNFKKLAPKTWRKFKKAKMDQSVKAADFVIEAWLEARYAWRPLLIDVDNAAKRIAYGFDPLDHKTIRTSKNHSDSATHMYSYTDGDWDIDVRIDAALAIKTRAGALLKLNLNMGSQLGLLDFPTIAWELTPFSFILDFVTDISGLLYRLTPTPNQHELAKWLSTSTVIQYTGTAVCTHRELGFIDKREISHSFESKVRAPLTTLPPLIVWNNNLDLFKLFDLAAIARGLQKGKLSHLYYVKT